MTLYKGQKITFRGADAEQRAKQFAGELHGRCTVHADGRALSVRVTLTADVELVAKPLAGTRNLREQEGREMKLEDGSEKLEVGRDAPCGFAPLCCMAVALALQVGCAANPKSITTTDPETGRVTTVVDGGNELGHKSDLSIQVRTGDAPAGGGKLTKIPAMIPVAMADGSTRLVMQTYELSPGTTFSMRSNPDGTLVVKEIYKGKIGLKTVEVAGDAVIEALGGLGL